MKGMLALVYPLKPCGVEHQALSTLLLCFELLSQPLMSSGVFQDFGDSVKFSELASIKLSCFNDEHGKLWRGNLIKQTLAI